MEILVNRLIVKVSSVVVVLVILFIIFHHHKTLSNMSIVAVKEGNITSKIVAVGNIVPHHSVIIKSIVSGKVGKLYHDAGDKVVKGEKLLEVEPAVEPETYATDKQQLNEDIISQQSAKQTLKQYEFLIENKAISGNDKNYLAAKTTFEKAVSVRKLAEQKVALDEKGMALIAGKRVSNTVISPIDGFILQRLVDVGDPVVGQTSAQSANALFTIANMNDLVFIGQVSEIDAAKIHNNMPAKIQVAAFPHDKIKGELLKISLQSVEDDEQNSPTNNSNATTNQNSPFNVGYHVEIGHLNIPTNILLRAGFSATATIVVKKLNHVLLIPEQALHFSKNKNFVWVPAKNHNHAKKQIIKIGLSDGVNAQVLAGLKLKQKIYLNYQSPSKQ